MIISEFTLLSVHQARDNLMIGIVVKFCASFYFILSFDARGKWHSNANAQFSICGSFEAWREQTG